MGAIEDPHQVPERFQTAWNAHDMAAFGCLFQNDARFVNRFGHYLRGRAGIVALHADIHASIYRDSLLENELIDFIPLNNSAGVIHFWSRLTVGPAHPAGPHAIDTLIQAVLTCPEAQWRILALENVTLTDPRTGAHILRA